MEQDAPTGSSSTAVAGATAIRTVRGDEFRQVLGRAFGARAIRSTIFDIGRDRRR